MTLALLIMAVGGAWADGTVYNSSVDVHTLQPDDILIEGAAITGITSSYGPKIVGYYMQSEDDEHYSKYNSTRALAGSDAQVTLLAGGVIEYLRTSSSSRYTYTPCDAEYNPLNAWIVTQIEDLGSGSYRVQITAYQYEPAIELKPDETGKNWILADMPASNIELQVEYFAESNLFLSKDALADAANIAVKAGELGVQFGEDGKSANPVAEGTAMTIKYNGTKKVLGVKVGKYNPDPKAVPLTFEVLTNGTIKVSFPRNGMKYSLNGGEKTAVPGGSESDISVKAGDIIEFYGNGSSYYNMGSDHTSFGGTAEVKVYGNIMSLLSETNFATATTLTAEQTFRELFRSYSKLTDASGLLLPAMTLTNNCYYEMFYSCSGMTAAPAELPAETLASSCYYEMFSSCSKLTTAPVLPATSLVSNCYRSMFSYCSKLSSVTCLATSGIDSNNSTYSWMQSAGSQAAGDKTFTADKTAEWPNTGNGIPSGWTRVDYVAPGN